MAPKNDVVSTLLHMCMCVCMSMCLCPCSCTHLYTKNSLSYYYMLCTSFILKIQWQTCTYAPVAKGQGDGRCPPLKFEVGGLVMKFTNDVPTGDFVPNRKGNWVLNSKKRKIHYTYLPWLGKVSLIFSHGPLYFCLLITHGCVFSACNRISNYKGFKICAYGFIFLTELEGWHLFSGSMMSELMAFPILLTFPSKSLHDIYRSTFKERIRIRKAWIKKKRKRWHLCQKSVSSPPRTHALVSYNL